MMTEQLGLETKQDQSKRNNLRVRAGDRLSDPRPLCPHEPGRLEGSPLHSRLPPCTHRVRSDDQREALRDAATSVLGSNACHESRSWRVSRSGNGNEQ